MADAPAEQELHDMPGACGQRDAGAEVEVHTGPAGTDRLEAEVDLGRHPPSARPAVVQAVLDAPRFDQAQPLPALLDVSTIAEHDRRARRAAVTVDGARVARGLRPGRPLHQHMLVRDGGLHLRERTVDVDALGPLHAGVLASTIEQ